MKLSTKSNTDSNLTSEIEVIDLTPENIADYGAFGTFCIIYKGEIISHHPISNTRFENIMKSIRE